MTNPADLLLIQPDNHQRNNLQDVYLPMVVIFLICSLGSMNVVSWLAYEQTSNMSNHLEFIVNLLDSVNKTEVEHLVNCLDKLICSL